MKLYRKPRFATGDHELRGAVIGDGPKATFPGLEWIAEWAFDGKWILDFYCPAANIGIEVDVGYHETPRQRQKDEAKTRACEARGIILVRVTNADVFGERVALVKKIRYGFLLVGQHRSRTRP